VPAPLFVARPRRVHPSQSPTRDCIISSRRDRAAPYEGPDVIEGAEHGEVEYALTKPEWRARAANAAHS
jgi:hypothetical protein